MTLAAAAQQMHPVSLRSVIPCSTLPCSTMTIQRDNLERLRNADRCADTLHCRLLCSQNGASCQQSDWRQVAGTHPSLYRAGPCRRTDCSCCSKSASRSGSCAGGVGAHQCGQRAPHVVAYSRARARLAGMRVGCRGRWCCGGCQLAAIGCADCIHWTFAGCAAAAHASRQRCGGCRVVAAVPMAKPGRKLRDSTRIAIKCAPRAPGKGREVMKPRT